MGWQERARAPSHPADATQGRAEQAQRLSNSTGGALVCAANLSEGRDNEVLDSLRRAAGVPLCDVHVDADHNRCVLTLVGERAIVVDSVLALGAVALSQIDLSTHEGVHPRLGSLDVVPFAPVRGRELGTAMAAREEALVGLGRLGIPGFRYGPLLDGTARSLPEVRRFGFRGLTPDVGPDRPHPTAGAVAVGARAPLMAWNAWLQGASIEATALIASRLRAATVRSLGFEVTGGTQVSCNLLDATRVTPKDLYEQLELLLPDAAHVVRCELVGLVASEVLDAVPESWWERLDLSRARTVEAAATAAGIRID